MRFGIAAYVAALALAPVPGLAQDTAAPPTNTSSPPPDTIGPRELEDFSLNGTVTRPAPTTPARPAPAPRPQVTPRTDSPDTATARERPAPVRERAAPIASPTGSLREALPEPTSDAASSLEPQPGFGPAPSLPAPATSTDLPDDQPGGFPTWLIALLLLGAGAGFYFWRQRSQPGYAVASGLSDALAAREPAPEPAAEPAPRPQPLQRVPLPRPIEPSLPGGVVTTRLRPWLDIAFSPGRCVVEDDKATIQFDVIVHNSGSAPARDVLIEASMFNAGPTQDQEIGAFFAHPVAKGDRIPAIPPMKRVALKSAVSLSRDQMRQFEVAGRRLFVPLIGFNALYRWSGGEGQTSASYLVGRDMQGEKMAPLRLDLGPRIFRGLGAREHNIRVRK